MGNYVSVITEFENELKYLRDKNAFLEERLEKMYERVGRLEKDIICLLYTSPSPRDRG